MRRWWASLLTVALSLLLVPGTAIAQDSTPLSVVDVEVTSAEPPVIKIELEERTISGGGGYSSDFTVTVDGVVVPRLQPCPEGTLCITSYSSSPLNVFIFLVLSQPIDEGAVVVVAYQRPTVGPITGVSGKQAESFRWKVGVGQISTVAEVYGALKSYFSGSVTLSEVEGVLSGDDQTYHEKLSEEAAAGRLHERLPADEGTNWSGEETETEGWVQIGSPSRLPDSSDTCGGETAPELTGGDQANFYWACSDENTSNGRWVPVRIPRPGVDYAWDYQLLRPGDPGYNEECLYVRRDEKGNPVLDENGDRIPRRVSKYDPATDTFTYNDGNSWDPIAEQCTTRGNPGSGPVFGQ